ncbi:MAG: malectin domain-containing carbohydrate-binding protein [Terriglobia bacterium]|jgi:hypothetical protein
MALGDIFIPAFCLWSTDMAMVVHNHDERGELENVLSSGIFAKAPGQAKLLKYICDEYFLGRADRIKEYNLATEALGRAADFDQNRDAIVRVEVHRLRRKLKEYYEGEGAGHALRIVIDPGHYAPRFVPRDEMPSAELEADSGTSEVRESQNFELPQQMGQGVTADTKPSGLHALPIAVGGLVLTVVMAGILLEWRKHAGALVKASPAASPSSLAGSPVVAGALDSVRILCGYPKDKYIDRAGNSWLGDRYYSGGATSSQPPQFVARAPDMTLYQTFRSGNFSYHIPLKPGNYELHLYFVETHYGPGSLSGGGEASRLFDVLLNGKPLLRIFDIIKDAGGNNIGDERVFKDATPAADGYLHLSFQALIDSPILNAIEIEPAPAGKINPIRIAAQNNSYTDHAGDIWSPDRYYSGGQLAVHITAKPVSQTSDPSLYSAERFGHFSYAIPVAPGKYRVTLRFAETYWGVESRIPSLPDQNGSLEGGAGSRVFDVYCNGVALLRNFDIFNAAGGPFIAVEKTFDNLEPNAEGKLMLAFVPVKDYASVTALEVVNEPH